MLEVSAFWYTALPSYEDSSALDSSHFALFHKENQLFSAVSHNKGFFQISELLIALLCFLSIVSLFSEDV